MPIEVAKLREAVRAMLSLDESLTPTERAVLETLLIHGRDIAPKELGVRIKTNPRSLYPVLEGLERRGFVMQVEGKGTKTYRVVHPQAFLMEIFKKRDQMQDIAETVRAALTEIYEGSTAGSADHESEYASATFSHTASISSLLERLKAAEEEVWILGPEVGWMVHTGAIRSELVAKMQPPASLVVRILVASPGDDQTKSRAIQELRNSGLEVRFCGTFPSPMILIDKEVLFVQTRRRSGGTESPTAFLRLKAPELCFLLRQQCEAEWNLQPSGG